MNSNPPVTISSGTPAAQLSYDSVDTAQEGPYMYRHGGYYYLFVSKGSCCGYDQKRPARGKEYRISVCRSTSVTGNFVDQSGKSCRDGGGTVVLASHDWLYGPGGQGVYDDPTLGPVRMFLRRPINRVWKLIWLIRSSTTITSIPGSAMPMARSASGGTRSTFQAAGRSFRYHKSTPSQ